MFEPSPELLDPDAVFKRLQQKLGDAKSNRERIERYRLGTADLQGLQPGSKITFKRDEDRLRYQQFIDMAKLNMCPLIVDSVVNDIAVSAFKDMPLDDEDDPPEEPAAEETTTDEVGAPPGAPIRPGGVASSEAQRRWRNQHMTVVFKRVAGDMCHHGEGYAWVSREGTIHYIPVISAMVEMSPLDPWDRWAGMFTYTDWAGADAYVLYIKQPGGKVYEYTKGTEDETWEVAPTPFSRIPLVPVYTPDGNGLYEGHLSTIDRINFLIFSRLVISDKQSFKELWLKGLPAFYTDPETGEMVQIKWSEELLQGPGGVNLLPGTESDIKETSATDISPLTGAVFSEIKHLAALTSTPLYILDPSSAQQSALGADLADKVHRTKIRTLRMALGEAAAEWMALSFEATGEPDKDFEVVWEPLEDESLAQRAQTAVILSRVLPLRTIWTTVLQFSPEEIRQIEADMQEARQNPVMAMGSGNAAQADIYAGDNPVMGGTEDSPLSANETYTIADFSLESGAPASDFIQAYLMKKGGQAPARDVIAAGQRVGYTEQSIKTARSRLGDKIRFERQRGANGKSVSYWVAVGR